MTDQLKAGARRLDTAASDFAVEFERLLDAKRDADADVDAVVRLLLDDVQTRGDAAVIEATEKFDGVSLTPEKMAFSPDEVAAAVKRCGKDEVEALQLAARRIEAYHARQMPEDDRYRDSSGVELGHRWRPVNAAGLYVPGGTASYPSSVLMNAIPAKAAGVSRVVMTVPTPNDRINPLVLAAAHLAGVDEIYRIGGAQAVGALAYGTRTIQAVDVIVGPGNAYVASAKKQVFGRVGIDMIAGPSEILVVADGQNDPAWIAADLLSQAEHDPSSQSILITNDAGFADEVAKAVESQLKTLDRRDIAAASWSDFGAIILVREFNEAVGLVDRIAPEHLEVALEDCDRFADQVRNAGAIFLGRYTPEAIGDYVAGTNHVLPTGRSARFASGLSVLDFMKRTSLVKCDAESLSAIGPAALTLAEAEGLGAHSKSVSIRMNR